MSDANQIELISRLNKQWYAPRVEATPIPAANWNDDPKFCIELNDEWLSHVIGVLIALDQPDAWLGDDDEIFAARQQVNEIIVAFMEGCDSMSNCCPVPLTRVNADGTAEVSFDNGLTWEDAGTLDPRVAAPQLPPIDDGDGNKKCKASNRVVRQLKDLQIAWSANLGTGLTILQLALAFASGVIIIFLSLGSTAAIIVPALLALAAAVVGTGHDAYDLLFTDDVWDTVLCAIYCAIGDDGQFTQAQFNDLLATLDSAGFDDTVALSFSSALSAWQVAGINNAAKIPTSDNLDCSDCACTGCGFEWSIFGDDETHFHGQIIDVGEDYVTVESGTAGHCYMLIRTADNTQGCIVTELEWLVNSATTGGGSFVGETITEGAPNHYPADIVAGGNCMAYIQLDNSGVDTPYTVKIHFIPCE